MVEATEVQVTRNRGIVYVLSNQAMPNYVKIGITNGNSAGDVQARMRQLDNTSVPLPFDCEYAAEVENYEQVERALLTAFGDRRVRNREFFYEVAPYRIKAIIKLHEIQEVTPGLTTSDYPGEVVGEVPTVPSPTPGGRAANFRFSLAGVETGAILEWADDREITCRVVDDRHVEYEGESKTLSALTKDLKGWPSARGSLYWIYQEETLQERRDRIEAEADDI